MEKLLIENLTKNEGLSEDIEVTPVNWGSINSPFSVSDVVNIDSQDWLENETLLDPSHDTHRDYRTASGQIVHWKPADGVYEPFYEAVAYELGSYSGVSFPFTSPAYSTGSDSTIVLGVVSVALFTTTLSALSETQRRRFFTMCNKTMFAGESVLAVWWRNFDWSNKFDSIAFGTLGECKSKLYYYPFDHSHIYRGPSGDRDIQILHSYSISENFWQRKYLNLNFPDCAPFIEKIEQIPDEIIKGTCVKWATRIGSIDKLNINKYLDMASEFSDFLVRSKKNLRRELDLFFQGVSYSS